MSFNLSRCLTGMCGMIHSSSSTASKGGNGGEPGGTGENREWNTRVLGVGIKQARCTCFETQMSPKAVWSRRLRNMQVSRC